MAEQRFDIEIRDNVAKSIRQEILGIGAAARQTQQSIRSMKAEMATMASATGRSSQATNAAAAASNTAAAAAKNETSASANKARQAKATAAALETEAQAQARLTAMVERSTAAQSRAAAASKIYGPGATVTGMRSSTATEQLGGASLAGALAGDVTSEAKAGAKAAEEMAQSVKQLGVEGELASHHMLNLGFQLNDVVVSLMSGQKPLTVFVQQGAQIGQIMAQARVGVLGMARAVAGLLIPFLPLVAAIGAVVAGVALLTHGANEGSTGLRHFTTEMGYTKKEVKELNDVSVDFGDTAKAIFQVGFRDIASAFGVNIAGMKKAWSNTLNDILENAKTNISQIYGIVAAGAQFINRGTNGTIGSVRDGSLANQVKSDYEKNTKKALGFFDDVTAQARKNARDKQDALAADMDPHIKKGPKAPKGPKEWDRAKELADTNRELDAQIGLLGYYGDALERNTQLEQIARTFAEHKKPLDDAERAALMQKITLLQEGQKVQQAMTAADEEANGAQRTYDATLTALNKMLDTGALSWQEYSRQLAVADRTLTDATDPLAAMNRELDKNQRLLGQYGKAGDAAQYLETIRTALEGRGESIFEQAPRSANDNGITVTAPKKLRSDVQEMMDRFKEQQGQKEMTSAFEAIDPRENQQVGSSSYILDHHKEMYAEIDRLRQGDVKSEEEATKRKQNLDQAYLDARLETTSSMLGQLATLQNSKNREARALGKAAAMAQATIDGIAAVQAALRGPPGPPWSFAIAGITGAMAAVNVAKIAGVGFMSGGYTGSGGVSEPAGVVHGQEYVFDAASTRRLGVGMLDGIRRGTLAPAPSNDNRGGPSVVVKSMPGVYVEERQTPTGEIELIAARVARQVAPDAVSDDIRRSPNSKTSKAIQHGFGIQVKR